MHIPILLEEIVTLLDIQPTDIVLDATMGWGGHSSAILERLNDSGQLIGIDQDSAAINHCKEKFISHKNVHIFKDNFSNAKQCLSTLKLNKVNKIVIDLGMSSYQLDHSGRGFSFLKDEPLDMRMKETNDLTAKTIINTYDADTLKHIFSTYADLNHVDKFVSVILENRKSTPINTTFDLVALIKKGFYFRNKRKLYMNICTRVFQALRIEVNQELKMFQLFLDQLFDILAPSGKIACLSFHSIEDKMMKTFYKTHKKQCERIGKKVIRATQQEIKINSRAKSAKLRILKIL